MSDPSKKSLKKQRLIRNTSAETVIFSIFQLDSAVKH